MIRTRRARCLRKSRKGAIAVITAFLLLAILGLIALAFDTGWIVMARTQLQAAADSSSLAGGTELLPGLGYFATKTPEEVVADATPVAVDFAGRNPNAQLSGSFVDGNRDVKFGKAKWDDDCSCFVKTPASDEWDEEANGQKYYNYVEVSVLRNQGGSNNGDAPVPLFFARIFGVDTQALVATATAAILPANGFRIDEGSQDTANVMPFAMNKEVWEKFLRGQEHYDSGVGEYAAHDPAMLTDPTILDDVTFDDQNGNGLQDEGEPNLPLFWTKDLSGDPAKQIMFDSHTVTDGNVSAGPDTHLELMVYPHRGVLTEEAPGGNFGTVDFGGTSNSTSVLKRQIEEGLNADDLSYYEDGTIQFSADEPLDAEADTGISAGLESALEAVMGQCKAIALFSAVTDESGNNTIYTLVEFISLTVVDVDLPHRLIMQRCVLVDDNAVPDLEEDIGDETTIFTPLILIR
jgi:hypothetical protein